ncbi:hypothetical protein DM02DRAFT_667936 [Periconia macrospinosa]|uniref:Uncharacterized protein n=1 Tax=Periconia macrospinosa TaxID=97972 RepID=A0A2V1E9D9_9PLEO|nr:hypothetical protein DM02DRAFT_667936 [Periconia macrospinosa]
MAPPKRQITLKDVQACLSANSTLPYSRLLRELVTTNANSPLKCTPKTAGRFGSVMVTLTKQSPFRYTLKTVSTPARVRDVLLNELETHKEKDPSARFCCPHINDSTDAMSDEDTAKHLINQLPHPTFTAPHCIPDLPCPYLDGISSFPEDDTCSFPAIQTMLSTSVLPAGTPIPLQHQNESTAYCTLLVGSIVWMVWPPTRENLTALQTAYDSCSANPSSAGSILDETAKRLIGGVTFVHNVGEVMRLPPFCIILGQAMKMSAVCKYSVVDASRIVPTLKMLPFIRSWWLMDGAGIERRTKFGSALLDVVEEILNGAFETFKAEEYSVLGAEQRKGVLTDLLEAWDDIIHGFMGILTAERANELKEMMKELLEMVGGVAVTCAICRTSTGMGASLSDHFDNEHWPRSGAGIVEQTLPVDDDNDAVGQFPAGPATLPPSHQG